MSLKQLEKTLRLDVKPALGCTEPTTIALAAHKASALLDADIAKVVVRLSANLLKNALEVGIPGTNGEFGIPLAAALGCYAKKDNKGLEILNGIDQQWLDSAKSLLDSDKVKIDLIPEVQGLYVEVIVTDSSDNYGKSIISGSHENLVLLEKNKEVILKRESEIKKTDPLQDEREALSRIPFKDFWDNIHELTEEMRRQLLEGVEMNYKVALAGLGEEGSLKIGNAFKELIAEGLIGNDVVNKAKVLTSAAVDARMSGCNLPVMTSAGSGNQGLTITIPLMVLAQELKKTDKELTEALAISHAITSILKYHSGTLSAMCGCVVCSGTGLATGVTYLMGGDIDDATATINNMVGGITGVICDGAKVGCAIKLICAIDSAFQAAMMALKKIRLPISNGVIGENLESSLANIGLIAAPGMLETDDQILAIMLGKPYKKN